MTPQHGRHLPDEYLTSLLIDSVVDYAIFVLDEHGGVRTWNSGAERLKGYRADEIIGRDLSVFYTDEDRDSGLPARLLAQAASEGRVIHTGWRVRKDGTRFYGDVTITALRDEDRVLRGFAKVTRDRTAEHESDVAMARALERERQAAHELARLDESRTKFMAAVSHDLQTPIGAILGGIDLLPESDVDDEIALLMALIRRNAERLQGMAGQLSEMSRLERGYIQVQPTPTDVATATRECVEALRPLLSGVEVRVEATGVALVDPYAFDRVMTNLLTNAAQHSPAGAPVTIATRHDGPMVVVTVEDRGPGVPLEERQRIFEEFRQGSQPAHANGLGLGLHIVRYYVEHQGGRVWVDDVPEGGARFSFSVPAPPDEPGPQPGRAAAPTDKDLHGTP